MAIIASRAGFAQHAIFEAPVKNAASFSPLNSLQFQCAAKNAFFDQFLEQEEDDTEEGNKTFLFHSGFIFPELPGITRPASTNSFHAQRVSSGREHARKVSLTILYHSLLIDFTV